MLMGTADVVALPTEKIIFLEDMTDTQKAAKVSHLLSINEENIWIISIKHCSQKYCFLIILNSLFSPGMTMI